MKAIDLFAGAGGFSTGATMAGRSMTHSPTTGSTVNFSQLQALAAPLDSGTFAGITTQPDGTHCAVVLLPERGEDLDHPAAVAWAQERGGQLPTRPIAALLFANCKPLLQPRWHWCQETEGDSYAWYCYFDHGYQLSYRKGFEGSAVAVRLIPISA